MIDANNHTSDQDLKLMTELSIPGSVRLGMCEWMIVAMLKPGVRQEGTVVKQVVEIPVITCEAYSML